MLNLLFIIYVIVAFILFVITFIISGNSFWEKVNHPMLAQTSMFLLTLFVCAVWPISIFIICRDWKEIKQEVQDIGKEE